MQVWTRTWLYLSHLRTIFEWKKATKFVSRNYLTRATILQQTFQSTSKQLCDIIYLVRSCYTTFFHLIKCFRSWKLSITQNCAGCWLWFAPIHSVRARNSTNAFAGKLVRYLSFHNFGGNSVFISNVFEYGSTDLTFIIVEHFYANFHRHWDEHQREFDA